MFSLVQSTRIPNSCFQRIPALLHSKNIWTWLQSSMAAKKDLSAFPEVLLDESGVFKYILISAKSSGDDEGKNIVRGFGSCEYHADIFDKTQHEFKSSGIKLKCLGGGRIERKNDMIKVYGYSQGYGKADHSVTRGIIQKSFPDAKITISDDGY